MIKRGFISQAEYDDIKKSRSFARAMAALAVYLEQPRGRKPTGTAMTSTERTRLHRARRRQEEGKA